eukprot:Pompholyxophrys_sp_v1_NODE_112_length_1918_cov_1.494364.p1 type:complete len:203 gc:universal NODE_112_length_1918_cov_1.494364:1746-1138(-)
MSKSKQVIDYGFDEDIIGNVDFPVENIIANEPQDLLINTDVAINQYHDDACPPFYNLECTLGEYYQIVFGDCQDIDRIYTCFEGRVRTYLYKLLHGEPIDSGHDYAIDLSALYLAKCWAIDSDENTMQKVDELYQSMHASMGIHVIRPLFSRLYTLPVGVSEKCHKSIRKAFTALDKDLNRIQHNISQKRRAKASIVRPQID